MFGLNDSLSLNRKRHFTFWIKFGWVRCLVSAKDSAKDWSKKWSHPVISDVRYVFKTFCEKSAELKLILAEGGSSSSLEVRWRKLKLLWIHLLTSEVILLNNSRQYSVVIETFLWWTDKDHLNTNIVCFNITIWGFWQIELITDLNYLMNLDLQDQKLK